MFFLSFRPGRRYTACHGFPPPAAARRRYLVVHSRRDSEKEERPCPAPVRNVVVPTTGRGRGPTTRRRPRPMRTIRGPSSFSPFSRAGSAKRGFFEPIWKRT